MMYAIAYSNGTKMCQSPLPFCGYSLETLKEMERAGYILLIAGKRAKFPTAAQFKEVRHG